MRRLLGLVLLGGAIAPAQSPQPDRERMAADLWQLAAEASKEWAYAEDRRARGEVDLPQLAEAFVARLPAVADEAAFVGLLREFVAAMKDGHAFVRWDGKERLPFRRWPFTVVDTGDGLVVDEVLATWTDEPAALQRGDVLLAVDGVPIGDVIDAVARRTPASTDASRRQWALRAAVYGDADPRRYQVQRADGKVVEVKAAAAAAHSSPAAGTAPWSSRMLADGIGYVRVTTFAHHDAKAWAETPAAGRDGLLAQAVADLRATIARVAAARALVLDLRGNGGGTDLLAMEVAAVFLQRDAVYYGLASRSWLGGWSRPSRHRLQPKGEPPRFTGQLVVLIDEHVFSAADNLCRCLDDLHPDVTFVGRPTGGGTGAPRPCVTLRHSGVVVGFCTMRVYGPDGGLIEGRGTVPDVRVARTRAGVLAGADEDLAAALRAVR